MNAISKIPTSTAAIVDELGFVKAQIAALADREKVLKAKLVAKGAGIYVGTGYDASVSIVSRETIDMEAVRAKLSPQFIAAHTNTTTSPTVRVVARVQRAA